MSSAAETEFGAVSINTKEGAVLRTKLEELGHKQPPTPIETYNTTVTGYRNGTIKQKHTKAMDMRFYWIRDRVKQDQFNVSQNTIRRCITNKCEIFRYTPTNYQ
jgi:hypothetical protein